MSGEVLQCAFYTAVVIVGCLLGDISQSVGRSVAAETNKPINWIAIWIKRVVIAFLFAWLFMLLLRLSGVVN